MIGKISKQEVFNDFHNKHLIGLVACQIDIKLFESLKPNEIVAERAGPIKDLKVSLTAGEALIEAKKKLKGHIKILELIKVIENGEQTKYN